MRTCPAKDKFRAMRFRGYGVVFGTMWMCVSGCAYSWGAGPFDALSARLIRDGYHPAFVRRVYSDTRCEFLSAIALVNIKHTEDTAAYRSNLNDTNMAIAWAYFTRHRELLRRAEDRYGVPMEIITAILLVETKCGLNREKAPVLNVLSTIATCGQESYIERGYKALKVTYPDITRKEIRRRATRRSQWAYKELRSFLDWLRENPHEDAPAIGGSWAGAVGLPQFMPTSLKHYGVDGDGDRRVDLREDADAIASICNYFRKNGWKPGIPARHQPRVIWRYNHSPLYVDAVLDIAERLAN